MTLRLWKGHLNHSAKLAIETENVAGNQSGKKPDNISRLDEAAHEKGTARA